MLKSSLLEILRTFSKQELAKFEDFIRSPYFNKKENVLRLFLEIKRYAPVFESEDLAKETMWGKLFPDADYNYGIMKNLIHDLGKLCESFLSEEVYKTNETQRSLDFLNSISCRTVSNIFINKIESAEKTFLKNFKTVKYDFLIDYYDGMRDLYHLKTGFLQANAQFKKKDELIKSPENLIIGCLIKCFETFHNVILNSLNYNSPVKSNITYLFLKELEDHSILKNILDYTKEHSPDNYPVLKCYYSMYKALSVNDSLEYFYDFKNNLSQNSGLFSDTELRELYNGLLTSFGNRKITTNNFHQEYFGIIQIGFKNKIIQKPDGTIDPGSFTSIVNVSVANDIRFTEEFINNYKDKLPPEFRESIYHYSMAVLDFRKGNFEKSLESISQVQSKDLFMKFDIKHLQLNIYYELNDRIAFDYSYDAMKHFIKSIKLTNESRIVTRVNYCEYIKELFILREKPDAFRLAVLKKEITDNKTLNKGWLLKKVTELERVNC
ncbi:MAG: hypothetical protein K1X85_01395 [Ignavibacteria bacterium]|nr:hypothetical protein [Ignavibacteria bacterium]